MPMEDSAIASPKAYDRSWQPVSKATLSSGLGVGFSFLIASALFAMVITGLSSGNSVFSERNDSILLRIAVQHIEGRFVCLALSCRDLSLVNKEASPTLA